MNHFSRYCILLALSLIAGGGGEIQVDEDAQNEYEKITDPLSPQPIVDVQDKIIG